MNMKTLLLSALCLFLQSGFASAESAMSEGYIRLQARTTYFRAWPMANLYNRRQNSALVPEPALLGGIVPIAPLNYLAMLTDYIDPGERRVACPNQDVVYGAALLALDIEPVVVQVPDFGDRFWVYQAVDIRTDSFTELGSMYGTRPGFYLLAGHDWNGVVPQGISGVFRFASSTGMLIPRVFQTDSETDKKAVQPVISQIDAYPLSKFDGVMKIREWEKLPVVDAASGESPQGETQWVNPDTFFDQLPAILAEVEPLSGEEIWYRDMMKLLTMAKTNPEAKKIMIDEARKTEAELIQPLLQFSSFGIKLPHNWGTIDNGANFGTDYYTRTAVARSNIFVNKEVETKYFYQDFDEDGKRLNGGNRYTVTFAEDAVPVLGFWSLTLYNEQHFFAPNNLNRYSIGTKNLDLRRNGDENLTLYIQADSPGADRESNWLPSSANEDFSLYLRAYWPKDVVLNGSWTPPPVVITTSGAP